MGSKLYIGNVSFKASEADLEDLFAQHGTVTSVKIITDRETGRSRGFAFVEMGSDEESQACVDKLNDTEVQGRNLRVSEAREKERSGGGGRNFNSNRRGGREENFNR
jgi:cold-inducible RNA-binding protein